MTKSAHSIQAELHAVFDATTAAAAQHSKWAKCADELSTENQRRYGVFAIGAKVDEVCIYAFVTIFDPYLHHFNVGSITRSHNYCHVPSIFTTMPF